MQKRSLSSARVRWRSSPGCRTGVGLLLLLILGIAPASAQLRLDRIAPLDNAGRLGYFVSAPAATEGARAGDAELCVWALADWVRQAAGRLAVELAPEAEARIRIYFVAPGMGQYGEMRAIRVGNRRGAEVYVRPATDALGPDIALAARNDPLLRESIVYLTCLHELGHALGLTHTALFDDVMYSFGFGGDIPQFFNRYRSRLEARHDIRSESGLSAGDVAALLAVYPEVLNASVNK